MGEHLRSEPNRQGTSGGQRRCRLTEEQPAGAVSTGRSISTPNRHAAMYQLIQRLPNAHHPREDGLCGHHILA